MSVVAFADYGSCQRIENPRSNASGSLVKIARILLQERRQYGIPDKGACNQVGVRGAVALSIPLCALPISTESVCSLLNSRNSCSHAKADGINDLFPGELELLFRLLRNCIIFIGDVEIGNDAQHTLFLFILNLGFCLLARREGNLH